MRENSEIDMPLPHAVRQRRKQFLSSSHCVDTTLWETQVDGLSDSEEKTSIQSFLCRSESNRLRVRDDTEDRWKKVMALPTGDLKVLQCVETTTYRRPIVIPLGLSLEDRKVLSSARKSELEGLVKLEAKQFYSADWAERFGHPPTPTECSNSTGRCNQLYVPARRK